MGMSLPEGNESSNYSFNVYSLFTLDVLSLWLTGLKAPTNNNNVLSYLNRIGKNAAESAEKAVAVGEA